MGRRDGFREATVLAVAVLGIGATIVHARDIIETGNLAPGNTIQNIANLLKPALLIGFLVASRRSERSPNSEAHTSAFNTWRGPKIQAAGLITGGIAAGFSIGFAVDQLVIYTLLGTLVGAGFATFVITRARPPGGNPEPKKPSPRETTFRSSPPHAGRAHSR
jgi:peptidoglycan/LPS O-acetylase OafA/YrhL